MNRGYNVPVPVPGCPDKMADGRQFTDYRQPDVMNAMAFQLGSEGYRQYLIHQASEIMRLNALEQVGKNGCTECAYQSADVKHLFNY